MGSKTLASIEADVTIRPLDQWPEGYERTPEEDRKSSAFDSKGILDRTITDLNRELRLVGAEQVVLQVDVKGQIRNDGLPYANASVGVRDPGVVLTFEADEKTHTYPADTYETWTENLRAIVYVLHDLRRISRHGVGTGREQYRGFTALVEDVDQQVTVEDAAKVLLRTAGMQAGPEAIELLLEDERRAKRAYRQASKYSHPDSAGGVKAHYVRVQRAWKLIEGECFT